MALRSGATPASRVCLCTAAAAAGMAAAPHAKSSAFRQARLLPASERSPAAAPLSSGLTRWGSRSRAALGTASARAHA